MRELINRAEIPAEHLMRPEISKLIVSYKDPFVPG
jgi:ATP sulfurylase